MSANRRTVVFIESAAAMAGVQFSTLYLAQMLDRSRWRPIVICPREGKLTQACRDADVETRVLSHPRLWSTSFRFGSNPRLPNPFAWAWNAFVVIRASQVLKKSLSKSSPDVIVTKGLSSHFIGGFAARRLSVPCVWHVQDFISERSFGIYRHIFGAAARRLPQRIIADGATIKAQLPKSLEPEVSVIHNGTDTHAFQPALDGSAVRRQLGISEDQLVIGHVGRITPWKGQHYLIEAFAHLATQFPNVTLLFVGSPLFDRDAYERRLRTMVDEFGLYDRIKFAGYRHDLPNVLAAMDIFAFTSIEKDTSPLALLSAMSSGLPIVAFDIEGVRELINNQDELLCVTVGSTEELECSLAKLISDEHLRGKLGRAARESAERNFNLAKHVSRIESILVKASSMKSKSVAEDAEKTAAGTAASFSEATSAHIPLLSIKSK